MGVFNRKGTVRDGLVLELDAANQKSWGVDQTKWKDTTSQGNDGTLTNGPVHSQGPFPGAGYVTFDGTGDYLTGPNSSDFNLSGNFTVEGWFNISALPTANIGGNQYSAISSYTDGTGNSGWELYVDHTNNQLVFKKWGYNSRIISNFTCSLNTWYHVAVVKDTSTRYIFINGVSQTLTTDDFAWTTTSGTPILYLGRGGPNQDYKHELNGYLSNVRIVNGTALYTSNFTPQLSELTSVPNTKLLTCQKGTITDNSISGHSITVTGNAAAVYNNVSYFDFDGTDQNITFTNSLFNSNQNFTFSVWFEGSTNSGSILSSTIAGGLCIKTWSSGSKIMIEEVGSPFGQGGQLAYSTNSLGIDDGQIHNIVVTRTGNIVAQDLKIYHNGEGPVATTYTNGGGSQTLNSTNVNVIGSEYNTSSSQTNYFDGKIHHVCAFQKALTSTEVTKNFNALRARFGI